MRRKSLRKCLDCILSQTFTDFELLLIDDGSKDKSGDICDEYAHKDDRVKVFHKENGGSEFRNYGHPCAFLGDEVDEYIAAAGHYGNKSNKLVKDYAENLGYKYLTASNKDEFNRSVKDFLSSNPCDKPILFEVFTETDDESNALEMVLNTVIDPKAVLKSKVKNVVKDIVGDKGVETIKKIIK